MTFDAVPPGTQPSRTRPTAICARTVGSPTPVRDSSDATSQPKPAMKTYWLQMPISTSVGFLRMYLKSSALSVMPIPNMMTHRSMLTKPKLGKFSFRNGTPERSIEMFWPIHTNGCGTSREKTTMGTVKHKSTFLEKNVLNFCNADIGNYLFLSVKQAAETNSCRPVSFSYLL